MIATKIKLICIAIFAVINFASCSSKDTLFREVPSKETGINFNNEIIDNASLNIVDYEYVYNGGGVGVGDFNNDGLADIYFAANRVSNKLYLNRGDLRFQDVTTISNTGTDGVWSKGVSVIDINNDGLLDIYVCTSVLRQSSARKNLLYINRGIDSKTKIPSFVESAAAYGLDDTSSTQMAAFFDYDNDGDLDVYLLVNELDDSYPNQFRPIKTDGSSRHTDRLLRNDWNEKTKHSVFVNVSKEAGITWEGHGLGLNIVDINNDGWKDIYVGNDYISNDLFYINDKGKFTNRCADFFKHTSRNSMGNDVADLNNDGLQDVIELDMMPEDNYRKKMMNNPVRYQTFQNTERYGYMHQYVRNTLQINQGNRLTENDSIGDPIFSDIALFSGVSQTDWSWSVLAIDVDNDQYRDLVISNGLPKDLTDLDFMSFRNRPRNTTSKEELLKQLPTARINNYIFRNNGNLTFTDKTLDWGWDIPSFSTGMAYADFDNDGDLDVIINNTNMPATFFENRLSQNSDSAKNFLRIKLKGDSLNINGIGSRIQLHYNGKLQVYENTPYRGYLSSVESTAHFGLGRENKIDSLIVIWHDGRKEIQRNIKVNQTLAVAHENAVSESNSKSALVNKSIWFTDVTKNVNVNYTHSEQDDIDFNYQRLIPRKLSQFGPAIAVGDINGDNLDDIVVGGDAPVNATFFIQGAKGFRHENLLNNTGIAKASDDMGICLFDADADSDIDLFIVSGGNKPGIGKNAYADQFYNNDGKGHFTRDTLAIPANFTSKSCVKAADYDNDGDLDLFIGGRVNPGLYPKPVSSFIYRNDTKQGIVRFTDVTASIAPELNNIGMVTDALWTDIDNDNDYDLMLTGEWMGITCLKNANGKLSIEKNNLSSETGWWNSITGADIDNDNDIDYIVGNYGQNGFLKASAKQPVRIFAKDFDNNSIMDVIVSTYIPGCPHGQMKEYPLAGRDELIEQMPKIKGKYQNYAAYANADLADLLIAEDRKDALTLEATNFNTGWIENKGNFTFVFHKLPGEAQLAPVFGIVAEDLNGDGNIDLLLNGNEFSMAPALGRNDALNGLLLQGNGSGDFKPTTISESGIFIPGNGKGAAQLLLNNKRAVAVSQNRGPLKIFQIKNTDSVIRVLPDDRFAVFTYGNGEIRKEEFYFGSSFLSQSGRNLSIAAEAKKVVVTNSKGDQRAVK